MGALFGMHIPHQSASSIVIITTNAVEDFQITAFTTILVLTYRQR